MTKPFPHLLAGLSTLSLLAYGADVTITQSFEPNLIDPGETFTITLEVSKGAIQHKGSITQILPEGFTAAALEEGGAEFSFESRIVKFAWKNLPADSVFTVSYEVEVSNKTEGAFSISGRLVYLDDFNSIVVNIPTERIVVGKKYMRSAKVTFVGEGDEKGRRTVTSNAPVGEKKTEAVSAADIREAEARDPGEGSEDKAVTGATEEKKESKKVKEAKKTTDTKEAETTKKAQEKREAEETTKAKEEKEAGEASKTEQENAKLMLELQATQLDLQRREDELKKLERDLEAKQKSLESREAAKKEEPAVAKEIASPVEKKKTPPAEKEEVQPAEEEEAQPAEEEEKAQPAEEEKAPVPNVVYRLQILADTKELNVEKYKKKNKMMDQEIYLIKNRAKFIYAIGEFTDYKEVNAFKKEMAGKKGVKMPLVVGDQGGDYLSASKVKKILGH